MELTNFLNLRRLTSALALVWTFGMAFPVSSAAETRAQDIHDGTRPDSYRSYGDAAQDHDTQKADNTARNQRDADDSSPASFTQSNKEGSIDITRRIREGIVERDELSTYAHNVKIITDDEGSVTLRGPVRNESEKRLIEQIAMNVAGNSNVRNQLEVAPSESSEANPERNLREQEDFENRG